MTTDDAYVGAQKVLITSDVSGKIIKVTVKEGQQVSTGDTLFQIDPVPFRLAPSRRPQANARRRPRSPTTTSIADVKIYGQTAELVAAGHGPEASATSSASRRW